MTLFHPCSFVPCFQNSAFLLVFDWSIHFTQIAFDQWDFPNARVKCGLNTTQHFPNWSSNRARIFLLQQKSNNRLTYFDSELFCENRIVHHISLGLLSARLCSIPVQETINRHFAWGKTHMAMAADMPSIAPNVRKIFFALDIMRKMFLLPFIPPRNFSVPPRKNFTCPPLLRLRLRKIQFANLIRNSQVQTPL
jgi:hypothetical protein